MITTPVLSRVRPAHRLLLLVGLLLLVLTQLVLSLAGRSATTAEAAVSSSDLTAASVPSGAKVVTASFNAQKVGRETPKAFIKELGVETNRSTSQYDDMSIIKSGGGKALRTRLDKGTIRDNPGGNHGAVLVAKLPRSYDKACISYRVRFSSNFDWSLGGKLPGLMGVAPGVDPGHPDRWRLGRARLVRPRDVARPEGLQLGRSEEHGRHLSVPPGPVRQVG